VVADDTNIWVNNAGVAYKKDALGVMQKAVGKGQAKVQALLGMIWTVALDRVDQSVGIDLVRMHSPSQVLPKANAATILSRMRRWGIYTSADPGSADAYGGQEVYTGFSQVPLKMLITCTDALPTNHLVQAMSMQDWRRKAAAGDFNAATTLHVMFTCMHHAACLAKKPGLLSVPNLCSNMVRLTRAMKSSKFQDNFEKALAGIAERIDRRVVPELPSSVKTWWENNGALVKMALSGLPPESQEIILAVFNDPWRFDPNTWRDGCFVHWCTAGCCPSAAEAKVKTREALRRLCEDYPAIPLLYRWKHWEPALNWAIRGTFCNGVLQYALSMCSDESSVAKFADLDPDSPDLSFSLKQEVRLTKSVAFLTSDSIRQDLGVSFLVSNPLADFMDHVSFIETSRSRVNLKECGLKLLGSTSVATVESLRLLNWKLLNGEKILGPSKLECFFFLHPKAQEKRAISASDLAIRPEGYSCIDYNLLSFSYVLDSSHILPRLMRKDRGDFGRILDDSPGCTRFRTIRYVWPGSRHGFPTCVLHHV